MPDNVNTPRSQPTTRGSGDEQIVTQAFVDALHGRSIDNVLAQVKETANKTSPQNWVTLANAALVHAGEIPATGFNPLVAQTSTEFGSGLYDFSWSLCTYATIQTPEAVDAYTAMLAAAALCLCPAEKIELRDLYGENRRDRNYGMANYHGPISMLPGNRMIWDTSEAALYAERSIAAPLAAWAQGQQWSWQGWEHPTLGWAMEAAVEESPDGHHHGHPVDLPTDPADLVELVNRLKMRSNQRLEILHLKGGGRFGLLSQSTFNTRGPVLVTEYLPEQKLYRQISPATQTGNGQWTNCAARLEDDGSWAVWQTGNESKRIEGRLSAEPEVHIVWDSTGCRFAGEPPPPEQLPDPIPELAQAIALYDQVLTQLGQQGYADSADRETRGRTAVEVMNRIAGNTRSSAREGTETLLADMKANDW